MLVPGGSVYTFKMMKGGGRTRKVAKTPAACNIYLCHERPRALDGGLKFKTVLGYKFT